MLEIKAENGYRPELWKCSAQGFEFKLAFNPLLLD